MPEVTVESLSSLQSSSTPPPSHPEASPHTKTHSGFTQTLGEPAYVCCSSLRCGDIFKDYSELLQHMESTGHRYFLNFLNSHNNGKMFVAQIYLEPFVDSMWGGCQDEGEVLSESPEGWDFMDCSSTSSWSPGDDANAELFGSGKSNPPDSGPAQDLSPHPNSRYGFRPDSSAGPDGDITEDKRCIRELLEKVDKTQEERLQMLMRTAEEIREENNRGLEEVMAQHSSSSDPSGSSSSSSSSSSSASSTSSSASSSSSSDSDSSSSSSSSGSDSDSDSDSDMDTSPDYHSNPEESEYDLESYGSENDSENDSEHDSGSQSEMVSSPDKSEPGIDSDNPSSTYSSGSVLTPSSSSSSLSSYSSNPRSNNQRWKFCKQLLREPDFRDSAVCKYPNCNKLFQCPLDLLLHKRMRDHLLCELCDEFFDTEELFEAHMFNYSHSARTKCPLHIKEIMSRTWQEDMESFLNPRPGTTHRNELDLPDYERQNYYCPYELCELNRGFRYIDYLADHRRLAEHWYCDSCKRFFYNKEEWEEHNTKNKQERLAARSYKEYLASMWQNAPPDQVYFYMEGSEGGDNSMNNFVSASREPPPLHSIPGLESTGELSQPTFSPLSSQSPEAGGSSVTFYGSFENNTLSSRSASVISSGVSEVSRGSTALSGTDSLEETLVDESGDEETLYDPHASYLSRVTSEYTSSDDDGSGSESSDTYTSSSPSSTSRPESPRSPHGGNEQGESSSRPPRVFKCRHCLTDFPDGGSLFMHLTTTKHFLSFEYAGLASRHAEGGIASQPSWNATPFSCIPCKMRFRSVDELEEHFLNIHARSNFAWMWRYCACGLFFERQWFDVYHHLESGSCQSGIKAGWMDRMVARRYISTEWKNSFLEMLEKGEEPGDYTTFSTASVPEIGTQGQGNGEEVTQPDDSRYPDEVPLADEAGPSSYMPDNNCEWIIDARDEDDSSTSDSSLDSASLLDYPSSSSGDYTGSNSIKSSSGMSGTDERESDPGSEQGQVNKNRTKTTRSRDDPNEAWYFVNVDDDANGTVVRIQSASDSDANEEDTDEDDNVGEIDRLVRTVKDIYVSLRDRWSEMRTSR
ncbi:hypothetical protein TWF506_008384 [Arthrobotrys conoides]|uniref:C2H2-type domain-containing protein n=1 Tax=Arthrobotrys conoides TaxID=74498 RepID=A0AAN8NVU2_9PEZI